MIEENKSIFNYMGDVLTTFGGTIVLFIIIGRLLGESAGSESTLFELGSAGMTYSTLIQMLIMSVLITVFRYIFFTDRLISNMPLVTRTVLMLVCIVATIIAFVILFGWFNVKDMKAWIGFIVSFMMCFIISAGFTYLSEKSENSKMQKALNRMQNETDR